MSIVAQQKELLGTVIEIKLLQEHSSFFSLCFDELQRIEQTYSRFLDNSELNKANAKLNEWQAVSDEFFDLIEKALEINQKTNGSFDITLKSKLEQLGYDKEYSFQEKPEAIQKEINNPIEINREAKQILLRKEIEIGGFGKGFALDQIAKLLEENKVDNYYINAGGDIYAKQGNNQDPWIILLEHPDDKDKAIGKLELNNQAIASSSPNRRKWKDNHHLINPKTQKPANDTKSIFVLAKTGLEADAYATALHVSEFQEAIELSKALPVEVLIISKENKMFQSKEFNVEFF